MNNIPISFIIPCFNCVNTLPQTIDSIINLNLRAFEVCLVNDCSTDKTDKIFQYYKSKYPKVVKTAHNEINMGGGYTRNACVKMTKYEWIYLVDSDNILDKKSFLTMYSSIKTHDNIIATQYIDFFYDFLPFRFIYKRWEFLKREMSAIDLKKTPLHPIASGNYMFRRSVFNKIDGYDTEFGALDTWSFGYKALMHDFNIKIVPRTKYFHRVSGKSYWSREVMNNNQRLRNLLLKYRYRLFENQILQINKSMDVQQSLLVLKNDFSTERINFLVRMLLKIYYSLQKYE